MIWWSSVRGLHQNNNNVGKGEQGTRKVMPRIQSAKGFSPRWMVGPSGAGALYRRCLSTPDSSSLIMLICSITTPSTGGSLDNNEVTRLDSTRFGSAYGSPTASPLE